MSGAPHSHTMEWFDLKKRAQQKLQQAEKCQVPSGDWDNLLMRFRKLREGLTAAAAAAELRCEVYLLSADVCAAADNMAELLKCLQQLVNNIYPALEQQQQQQQQQVQDPAASILHQRQQQPEQQNRSEQHQEQQQHQSSNNSRTTQGSSRFESAWSDTSSNDSDPGGSSSSSCTERLPEVAAALLLYFVCVPRQPVIQEITKQLRAAAKPRPGSCRQHTPTATAAAAATAATGAAATTATAAVMQVTLISSPLHRQAVLDTAAALRCNWCAFFGSYFGQNHPLLVRAVMSHHVERMRVQAVRKMGVAYRMLPTAVFQRWLQLGGSSSSRVGSDKSKDGNAQGAAPAGVGAGVAAAGCVVSQHVAQCIAEVLKKASECGSKAAGIAADRFAGQGEPPDTLFFRAA